MTIPRTLVLIGISLLITSGSARAQLGDPEPILRLETAGPTAQVTALALSPDGSKLYAAGFDKIVRVWNRDDKGQFSLDTRTYRVPIGPGLHGAINALAVSPDGKFLAVAGQGVVRGLPGIRQAGIITVGAGFFTREMREDQGAISVFNTQNQTVRLLRGHAGNVRLLQFAAPGTGGPLTLVSVGHEWKTGEARSTGSVRVWDVDAGKEVGQLKGLTDPLLRPAVAAWRTGDRPADVRVALALGDTKFRVWEPGNDTAREGKDRVHNVTAAWLADRDRVVTATYGEARAQLQMWQVAAEQAPRADQDPGRGNKAIPLAMTLLSSRGNGRADHAAVVVRQMERNYECRLQVYALDPDNFGKMVFDKDLWDGSILQPVLASSANGSQLVVAGHPKLQLLAFSTRDLVAGTFEQHIIRGEGEMFLSVAFATRGNARGIVLGHGGKAEAGMPLAPRADDWVFNADQRVIEMRTEGWRVDSPAADKWSAKAVRTGDRVAVKVTGEDQEREVLLPLEHSLQDFALLPPAPPLGVPLLAIASFRQGEPRLTLYNARTGEQLRHFTGHTGLIRGVAFSGDGKLLVSVSQDKTVSVWSLTELKSIFGRVGLIPGLAVREDGKFLAVAQIEDGPAKDVLTPGERIEGIVLKDKVRQLGTTAAFYEAIDRIAPGQTITLSVRRPGEAQPREVALKVGQGIDDRKPLFTLFVTQATEGKQPEWIGWSPLGPYDSSGQQIEKLLAWHLNPRTVAGKIEAVGVDQYREQFHRKGLLRASMERGELAAIKGPGPEAPRIELLLKQDEKLIARDIHNHHPILQPGVLLRVTVSGRPLETIQSISWKVGEQPEQPWDLKGVTGEELEAKFDVPRGLHIVRVRAVVQEPQRREYTQELLVRHQLPPPRVELMKPAKADGIVVQKSTFALRALLHAAAIGEDVRVSLVHRAQGTELLRTLPATAKELERKLELKPGDNSIEIIASNARALPDFLDFETTRFPITIIYKKKEDRPVVQFQRVVPLNRPGTDVIESPKGVLIVDAPRVRIEGEITADADLTAADLYRGKDEGKPLPGLDDKPRKLKFEREIVLSPGEQLIRIATRTASSDPGEREITIEYRPRLPVVEAITPQGEVRLVAGKDRQEVRLEARVQPADNDHAYTATVLVNDKASDAKVTIDGKTLTALVPVEPGAINRIELKLANGWKTTATYGDLKAQYVRPVSIVGWRGPRATPKPEIDLEAEVKSALPLDKDSVFARVKERKITDIDIVKDGDGWVVRLKKVPLDEGLNEVQLEVSNNEDRSARATWPIRHTPPRPPVVRILEPSRDDTASAPSVTLRFEVKSETPLKAVAVVVTPEKKAEWKVPPGEIRSRPDGDRFVFDPIVIPLDEGVTRLRVEALAEDDKGRHELTRVMTWVPPPVALDVTNFATDGRNPQTFEPTREGGRLLFPPAPTGRVKLTGKVTFQSAEDVRLKQTAYVRIFVNDYQQVPVALGPAETKTPLVRPFTANLLLNRAEKNQVEVTLPALPREKENRTEFAIDCVQPARARRLHVLLVSAQEVDRDELKKQFLDAIKARPDKEKGGLRTPMDDEVIPYGPLVGLLSRPVYVNNQLHIIRERIRDYARSGSSSVDVVVFYFKGGEVVNEAGHFFQASGQKPDPQGLTCKALAERFSDTPGAHILLFDVDRQPEVKGGARGPDQRDEVARWKEFHGQLKNHVFLLRYSWLPTNQANKPSLLTALEEAVPKSSKLEELRKAVQTYAEEAQKGTSELSYHEHLSQRLGQTPFGARLMKP